MRLRDAPRRWSLFWHVVLIDVGVLVAAAVVLAVGPFTISAPIEIGELAVLFVGLVAILAVSLTLLHHALRPLETLTATMRRIDPLRPGQRVEVDPSDREVAALAAAFNEMLDRLESERRGSARRALAVQESERRRVARELHDEVGQTLTAMLLQIEGLAADVPERLRAPLDDLRETARGGAEDLRRIATRLRPEALEELGLRSALLALARGFSEQTGVRVDARVDRDLPALSRDGELVLYRVAQEALTNVARHARATHVELSLARDDGTTTLRVADDGAGFDVPAAARSHGVLGMRERAILVGGRLELRSAPGQGTSVVLRLGDDTMHP